MSTAVRNARTALRRGAALLLIGGAALISACGYSTSSNSFGGTGGGGTTATITSISVEPMNATLPRGLTRQFTATAIYSDGSKLDVTATAAWTSSAASTAMVNTSGVVTGLNLGAATITATLDTVSGSTTLTVTAATLVSIDVTPASPQIAAGAPQQFTATGIYTDYSTQNITTAVSWTSANTTVATISNAAGSAGLATGVRGGTSSIIATLNGVSGSTVLTVSGALLVSITVTPANSSAAKGTQQNFTATGLYNDGTQQNLTTVVNWSSSTAAASISNVAGSQGQATAAAVGATTITATYGAITGSTHFTVTAATLVSIAVTAPHLSIAKGTTVQFTATGTYSDQTTQNLTQTAAWNSATATVATITNAPATAGVATGMALGTTVITAMSAGVTSAPVTLTVTPAALVSIAVTPANAITTIGGTVQYAATGTYTDGSTQTITTQVTWNSGTPSVATISNAQNSQGLASAIATGTTAITATDPATQTVSPPATLIVNIAYAYATNIGDDTVSEYSIGTDGTLTLLNTVETPQGTVATGQRPFSVAITPTGGYAYVANSSGTSNTGSISAFSVAADGSLIALTGSPVASGPNPNSVTIDPSGTHLYATNLSYTASQGGGPGSISQYTIDPATGALTPIAGADPVTGVAPASLAINPLGTFAYVANDTDGTVSEYSIDPNTGGLVPLSTPTIPAGTAANYALVDPSGRFLYVANQYSDNLSEYSIDPTTGLLTSIGTTANDANALQPRFIAIDTTGTYVYTANYGSNSVSEYTITQSGPNAGVLTLVADVTTGPTTDPNGVTIDPTGKYLYAADRQAGTLSEFSIGVGGALTPLIVPPNTTNTVAAGTGPTSIGIAP